MKILNKTKNRKATPNEIAKAIIIDNLQMNFYFHNKGDKLENNTDSENQEIIRHIIKHVRAIEKKLNLTDFIDLR